MVKENQEIWKIQLMFEDLIPHCDPDLETFSHDTPDYNDAPSYQVGLHTVQWFRRYLRDKGVTHGQTHGPTDRQTDRQTGRLAGRQADRQTDRRTAWFQYTPHPRNVK